MRRANLGSEQESRQNNNQPIRRQPVRQPNLQDQIFIGRRPTDNGSGLTMENGRPVRQHIVTSDDQRKETAGFTLSDADIVPTRFDKIAAQAQDEVARRVKQARSLEELLKYRYIQTLMTWHNLQTMADYKKQTYSTQQIIEDFGYYFNATNEVQQVKSLYRKIERYTRNDNFYMHMHLDITEISTGYYKARAMLVVPEHRLRRYNPPFSGEIYYFVADSICLTGDIKELIDSGKTHFVLQNVPWERVERELWPSSKGNPADMLQSNMDPTAVQRFMKELTLESYEVEAAKQSFYILAGVLGRLPVSDPQSYNLTRLKNQLR